MDAFFAAHASQPHVILEELQNNRSGRLRTSVFGHSWEFKSDEEAIAYILYQMVNHLGAHFINQEIIQKLAASRRVFSGAFGPNTIDFSWHLGLMAEVEKLRPSEQQHALQVQLRQLTENMLPREYILSVDVGTGEQGAEGSVTFKFDDGTQHTRKGTVHYTYPGSNPIILEHGKNLDRLSHHYMRLDGGVQKGSIDKVVQRVFQGKYNSFAELKAAYPASLREKTMRMAAAHQQAGALTLPPGMDPTSQEAFQLLRARGATQPRVSLDRFIVQDPTPGAFSNYYAMVLDNGVYKFPNPNDSNFDWIKANGGVRFRIANINDAKRLYQGETISNSRVRKLENGMIQVNAGGDWLTIDSAVFDLM